MGRGQAERVVLGAGSRSEEQDEGEESSRDTREEPTLKVRGRRTHGVRRQRDSSTARGDIRFANAGKNRPAPLGMTNL